MDIGFNCHNNGELLYYTIDAFEKTGLVRHGFTGRLGGVSSGDTKSLNLGFNRNDTRENVLQNFAIAADALGIERDKLVLSDQVHDNRARVITAVDCGKGMIRPSDIIGVDALVCAERGVPFATFYADCVPLFFLDPITRTCGLAHSGWKSTVKNIARETVLVMNTQFGANPGDILVGIGPSIGSCHFEVDIDVALQFPDKFIQPKGNKYHVDLWGVIIDQLTDSAIDDKNITLAQVCTYCNNDTLFSYRGDKGKTGSMAAFMELI